MTHRFFCLLRRAALALAACSAAAVAFGYSTFGRSWASGDIVMQLQLGAPAATLTDGATSWNDIAVSALDEWNAQLTRSHFTSVRNSTSTRAQGNRINNVFFDSTVYGEAFGTGVLAVTVTFRSSRNTTEGDVVFNSARTWDSYRGALRRNGSIDFRRVALHEFGHVLGLDHPDEAGQSVVAVMNSIVSNTEFLQSDDIEGVKSLYGVASGTNAPAITAQPQGATAQVTGSATLNVVATGTEPLTYTWRFRATGAAASETIPSATGPSLAINSVQLADAGTYTVTVSNNAGAITSSSATLNVTPIPTNAGTTLANISTRGTVGTGANVLIAGLVVRGNTPKNVLVRAVGPALAEFGVGGALAAPELRLVDQDGRLVAQNNDWKTAADATRLSSEFTRLGAFQFKTTNRDAAILTQLPPGNYTAQVSGIGGTTGVALVEAYDADADAVTSASPKLVNIATRGYVGTGDYVLIAGLVVRGPGPRTYLIRAVGNTLADFGVTDTLADPLLQIYRDETLLRQNDDWDTPSSAQPALRSAATQVGAFALTSRTDSAMLLTLQPGAYTAKVSGFSGETGVGLIEIYEMP